MGAIEREPRGTWEYEQKFARLSREDKKTVELAEDSVLADLGRTHARRTLADGTTLDMTAYREFDVLLTFWTAPDGRTQFLDFRLYEPL